ncbi:unnamed protein product [Rotaria sp. Silwood1]|nr:unnamed protein product [Rotaria sp. Silwood1]CAF0910716.1 unnamed protein product [Rotaria sp. Silwood1]CAF1061009.1 unnamed protein product [Rotaria sp. Silwood1]CAF3373228.1 unnamed protein product [Rotaria sp. Silwood1]CAF3391529.1 unnamed protein product [Rotaria sp. Silwood1]
MYLKYLRNIIFILIFSNNYLTKGENVTNTSDISILTTATTITSTSTLTSCPEGYQITSTGLECQPISERQDNKTAIIKNPEKASGGIVRRLFFLFLGCLLTIFVIFALIMTYNHITEQNHRPSSTNSTINPTIGNRFQNILQSISLNNFRKNGRFHFFSISNNNYSSGNNRQGETSRTHLNENQDEALLFDDPYADGGISSGIHGSSTNPYKSLTLSVT